jgi:hypothetical protein
MILRYEGATLTFPLGEPDLTKEPADQLSLAGARPFISAMVGHRPVLHCGSGAAAHPDPDTAYPAWEMEELLALKAVGV